MGALVVYLRSPSDSAVELGAQEEAIRAWARARRHRIVTVTFDTAADLELRGGLAQALALIRDASATGLVVHGLESLADDLIAQEQVLAEVHRLGARVHTVSGPSDERRREPADETRRMVRAVLRAAARNEHAVLALRSAHRRPADGRSGSGSPAYGFRVEDGEVRPEPADTGRGPTAGSGSNVPPGPALRPRAQRLRAARSGAHESWSMRNPSRRSGRRTQRPR